MEFRAELEMKKGNPRKQGDMEGGNFKICISTPFLLQLLLNWGCMGETHRNIVERNN